MTQEKIYRRYQDPIDTLSTNLSIKLEPYFKKMNFTPNGITTLSIIAGVMSIYFIFKEYFIIAGLFCLLCYFFDVMDGSYARRYKMVSKFGDYYDHFSDIITAFGIFYALYKKNNFSKIINTIIIIIIIILSIMSLKYVGCQEKDRYNDKTYGKYEENILSDLMCLCKTDPQKYFENNIYGIGTFNMFVILLIMSYSLQKRE